MGINVEMYWNISNPGHLKKQQQQNTKQHKKTTKTNNT